MVEHVSNFLLVAAMPVTALMMLNCWMELLP